MRPGGASALRATLAQRLVDRTPAVIRRLGRNADFLCKTGLFALCAVLVTSKSSVKTKR